MNRRDFQNICRKRIKESTVLIKTKNYDGAYYLGGYSIECALKSCIAKLIKKNDFPDKKFINDAHTHNLLNLIKLAELERELDNEISRDTAFGINWNIVKDWNESSRYQTHDEQVVNNFYRAIINKKSGVLKWVKKYW
ncbi:MAG: HEPN domain-containing protein [bacterium]